MKLQIKLPGARTQPCRERLAASSLLRRRGCCRRGRWSALAWSYDCDLYVVELRLRIVARPDSDFALGYFAVIKIENHLVVVVTTEVSTLRDDLEAIPGVFVRRHDA